MAERELACQGGKQGRDGERSELQVRPAPRQTHRKVIHRQRHQHQQHPRHHPDYQYEYATNDACCTTTTTTTSISIASVVAATDSRSPVNLAQDPAPRSPGERDPVEAFRPVEARPAGPAPQRWRDSQDALGFSRGQPHIAGEAAAARRVKGEGDDGRCSYQRQQQGQAQGQPAAAAAAATTAAETTAAEATATTTAAAVVQRGAQPKDEQGLIVRRRCRLVQSCWASARWMRRGIFF